MTAKISFSKRLKFALALIVAFAILPLSIAGASSAGFPMYSWGNNTQGRLGHGDTVHRDTPERVGEASNWTHIATGSQTSLALNANGELFGWGANWNANQMGQGANPNPGSGNITAPTRIGTANDWIWVAARGDVAAAINSEGHIYMWGDRLGGGINVPTRIVHEANFVQISMYPTSAVALTDEGYLYSWGDNNFGQLGLGDNVSVSVPTRIGDRSDWASAMKGNQGVLALTDQGHMYSWGNNASGRLGLGDTSNRNVPTRIDIPGEWITIGATSESAAAAINSDGELWTWGSNATGQLGRGAGGSSHVPVRVGTESNWTFLSSANSHFLAVNDDYELWTWGNNAEGQLGIGVRGGSRNTPQFVMQSFGFAGTARGGGLRSFMLMHTEPVAGDFDVQKRLQKPEGTTLLNDITFVFTFERNSFNGDETQYTQVPNIPNRSIVLNSASFSTSPAGGITTTIGFANALEDIEFAQAGIYSWIVREAPTTGVTPPSNIVDSQAVYEFRVYVAQDGIGAPLYIYAITLYRLYCNDGEEIDPPLKVDDFTFTNVYTRTTTGTDDCYGALVVAKNVTGQFAPLNTIFNFEVTVTRTAMCPENRTFIGQVYNADGTTSGAAITFTSGTAATVNLTHGQRLVFDEFLVGTRFTVTELAADLFTASVDLLVDGSAITVAPNTAPNQALSIGGPHIAGDAENSAAFTNAHFYTPPTGLVANNVFIAIPVIAAVGLGLYFVRNYRKRIEEMPLA